MESAPHHATEAKLQAALAHILDSPRDSTLLRAIVIRPQTNQRQLLNEAELSLKIGIVGDRWMTDHWKHLPDSSSDPESQVSLMNSRVLETIAGCEEALQLAGDNLILDLDLSEENLPPGSCLKIGGQVMLELTAESHTGCKKFAKRYGKASLQFVNGEIGTAHNFRGRFAKIVESGRIAIGDVVAKM